MTARYDEQLW